MTPLIRPLGDSSLLVRFGDTLDDAANRAALEFARKLEARAPDGAIEICQNLVSVLVRFDPRDTDGDRLGAELSLLLSAPAPPPAEPNVHFVPAAFGGREGPDLEEVAKSLKTTPERFVLAHNATRLRVLAVGFAPGFVYCGFHPRAMQVPRRSTVRRRVPAGTILFAAGQTAIAATDIPTGWHVIGRTSFINFDSQQEPPLTMLPGDIVRFEAEP